MGIIIVHLIVIVLGIVVINLVGEDKKMKVQYS